MKDGRPEGRLAMCSQVVILGCKNSNPGRSKLQADLVPVDGANLDLFWHRWWNGFYRRCSGMSMANNVKSVICVLALVVTT